MSQALAYDTSTWSAPNFRTGRSAGNYPWDTRNAEDFLDSGNFGRGVGRRVETPVSVMEFQPPPGAALGLATPSGIKARARKIKDFFEALQAGILLAISLVADDEIDVPDLNLWKSTISKMLSYAGQISAPLVHPLQLGGVSFEWHDAGMNIEIRFRGEQDIFVVIEDARQEIPEFYGKDPSLHKAGQALGTLIRRQA